MIRWRYRRKVHNSIVQIPINKTAPSLHKICIVIIRNGIKYLFSSKESLYKIKPVHIFKIIPRFFSMKVWSWVYKTPIPGLLLTVILRVTQFSLCALPWDTDRSLINGLNLVSAIELYAAFPQHRAWLNNSTCNILNINYLILTNQILAETY